jgi:hypothetical protein
VQREFQKVKKHGLAAAESGWDCMGAAMETTGALGPNLKKLIDECAAAAEERARAGIKQARGAPGQTAAEFRRYWTQAIAVALHTNQAAMMAPFLGARAARQAAGTGEWVGTGPLDEAADGWAGMAAAEASANAEQGSFDTLPGAGLDSAGSAKPTVAAPVASAEELARSGTVESKKTSTRESAKASAVRKRLCREAERRRQSCPDGKWWLDTFLTPTAADTAAMVPKAGQVAETEVGTDGQGVGMDVDDPAGMEVGATAAALGASAERVPFIAPRGRDLASVHCDWVSSADCVPMVVDELTKGTGAPAVASAGLSRRAGLRQNPPLSRAGSESARYQQMEEDLAEEMGMGGPEELAGSRASELARKKGAGRTKSEWTQERMELERRQQERLGSGSARRQRTDDK